MVGGGLGAPAGGGDGECGGCGVPDWDGDVFGGDVPVVGSGVGGWAVGPGVAPPLPSCSMIRTTASSDMSNLRYLYSGLMSS